MMITEEQLNQLKLESKLSETFCMANDAEGERWVVFGDYITDSATFNAMLLGYFVGRHSFMRNIKTRLDYDYLRSINNESAALPTDYFINRMIRHLFTVIKTRSKEELVARYKECIEICNGM